MTTLTVPTPGGDWTLDTSVCSEWDELGAVTGRAATMAAELLWRLSGRRFGTRDVTLRPCNLGQPDLRSTYNSGFSFPPGLSALLSPTTPVAPSLTDLQSGDHTVCAAGCSSLGRAALTLPFPVLAVTDLTVESTSVPVTGAGSSLAILDHRTVVRQDGEAFPATQDLTLPLGDPGTWSITVTVGTPLPADTPYVLGILACEMAKSMSNLKCRLPKTLQSLSRQGVSIQLVAEDYLQSGLVGVSEVDHWLVSVNPHRLQSPPTMATPESIARRPRQQTWTS